MKRTFGKQTLGRSKIVVLASAAAAVLSAAPLLAAGTPQAHLGKTDGQVGRMLSAKPAHGTCAVIAKVDGSLTLGQQAKLTALGADITRHLGFIHSVALTLPAHNLPKLAALPFISHLSYDGIVKKSDGFTDASTGAAYARQQYGLTGKGVTVAVIDSGINLRHDDLQDASGQGRTLAYPDFIVRASTNCDYCGHGTHVAGIIAGDGADSTGSSYTHTYSGVAPQASLLSLRVLDRNGACTVSNVLAALQWLVANKSAYNGIRVANLSLGHPVSESYTTDPLCQAVEAAWKAGIVVVCAAGNNGRANPYQSGGAANEGWGTAYGSIQSPGNDPYVITVGAAKSMDGVHGNDRIATYSSRGPSRLDFIVKPDIIAPGNKVISLLAYGAPLFTWGNAAGNNGVPMSAYQQGGYNGASSNYFVLSGTSMAAPVVSGAAALMLQANPSLTPDTIKARLMASADKWTDPSGNADPCTYGAGYLNIPAALVSILIPTQYALSPQLTVANGTFSYSAGLLGSTPVWGSKAISGSKAVSGATALYGSKAVSGSSAIAMSKAVSGSSAVADTSTCKSSGAAVVDLSCVALKGE